MPYNYIFKNLRAQPRNKKPWQIPERSPDTFYREAHELQRPSNEATVTHIWELCKTLTSAHATAMNYIALASDDYDKQTMRTWRIAAGATKLPAWCASHEDKTAQVLSKKAKGRRRCPRGIENPFKRLSDSKNRRREKIPKFWWWVSEALGI